MAQSDVFGAPLIGSAKLTWSGFKEGFEGGLLKDKFAFFEGYRSPIAERTFL